MIRLFLLMSLVSGAVLFRYPAVWYTAPPDISVQCEDFRDNDDYQTILDEKGPVFYSRGMRMPLKSGARYFAPPQGNGYFQYEKIGREIAYFANPDELYWKRESASYPVSDPDGKWILLLSGDLTAVRLMDHNGNAATAPPLAGVLMTDYAFTRNWRDDEKSGAAAAVLFSSGPLYLVRFEPLFKIFTLTIPDTEKSFAKSVAVSSDRIAIHLQQEEEDYIREYRLDQEKEVLKELESAKLPYVIPHRIPMAITDSGVYFSSAHMLGQVKNGNVAWMSDDSMRLVRPADASSAEVPGVEFQGDAILSSALTLIGSGSVLMIAKNELPLALAMRQGQPFRLLDHQEGVSIEDRNGYCTVRPSASL